MHPTTIKLHQRNQMTDTNKTDNASDGGLHPMTCSADLTINAGATAAKCPNCGFWMDARNPPVNPNAIDLRLDMRPPPEWSRNSMFITDSRPTCPDCGIRLNLTIILPNSLLTQPDL